MPIIQVSQKMSIREMRILEKLFPENFSAKSFQGKVPKKVFNKPSHL